MHVGTLRVSILLPDAHSLKDKRQIVKSIVETTRNRFNVSVSEVDDLDLWRRATLGLACVANDARFVNQVLDKIVDTLENSPTIQVADVEMELL